jgi:hypothetical protein
MREVLLADFHKVLESPKVAALIMGKGWVTSNIAPWGPYISFSLAHLVLLLPSKG